VANARIHGTTGEIPAERLVRERPHLQPIPLPVGGTSRAPLRQTGEGRSAGARVPYLRR
jgi:hypothetical protein